MITKSLKTTRTQRKNWIFPHESHEKSPFVHCNTLVRYREGGRTVGSGRVATIMDILVRKNPIHRTGDGFPTRIIQYLEKYGNNNE